VPRWTRLRDNGRLAGLPGRVLLVAGAALGAYLTMRLPIMIVVQLLAALDAGVLIYWFYFRHGRRPRAVRPPARAPMRSLADVMTAAGIVMIVTALWVTALGVSTEFGVTNETTAKWGELAAAGFQVSADQPAAFGARCLIVAASVWTVGFGLTKATGS
jgi:hypothetical protein